MAFILNWGEVKLCWIKTMWNCGNRNWYWIELYTHIWVIKGNYNGNVISCVISCLICWLYLWLRVDTRIKLSTCGFETKLVRGHISRNQGIRTIVVTPYYHNLFLVIYCCGQFYFVGLICTTKPNLISCTCTKGHIVMQITNIGTSFSFPQMILNFLW